MRESADGCLVPDQEGIIRRAGPEPPAYQDLETQIGAVGVSDPTGNEAQGMSLAETRAANDGSARCDQWAASLRSSGAKLFYSSRTAFSISRVECLQGAAAGRSDDAFVCRANGTVTCAAQVENPERTRWFEAKKVEEEDLRQDARGRAERQQRCQAGQQTQAQKCAERCRGACPASGAGSPGTSAAAGSSATSGGSPASALGRATSAGAPKAPPPYTPAPPPTATPAPPAEADPLKDMSEAGVTIGPEGVPAVAFGLALLMAPLLLGVLSAVPAMIGAAPAFFAIPGVQSVIAVWTGAAAIGATLILLMMTWDGWREVFEARGPYYGTTRQWSTTACVPDLPLGGDDSLPFCALGLSSAFAGAAVATGLVGLTNTVPEAQLALGLISCGVCSLCAPAACLVPASFFANRPGRPKSASLSPAPSTGSAQATAVVLPRLESLAFEPRLQQRQDDDAANMAY